MQLIIFVTILPYISSNVVDIARDQLNMCFNAQSCRAAGMALLEEIESMTTPSPSISPSAAPAAPTTSPSSRSTPAAGCPAQKVSCPVPYCAPAVCPPVSCPTPVCPPSADVETLAANLAELLHTVDQLQGAGKAESGSINSLTTSSTILGLLSLVVGVAVLVINVWSLIRIRGTSAAALAAGAAIARVENTRRNSTSSNLRVPA